MSKPGDDYIVQPVMKALQVLDRIARQGHDMTLTEIVAELKMPKTTVFRYLQTLSAASFLHHDQRRDRYGVGPRFRSLASLDKSLRDLRDVAAPEMADLLGAFNETVNLAVLSERHVVYIDVLEPSRTPRTQARVGNRHPVHSTSLGKAMLAFLPQDQESPLYERPLSPVTIRTLTDMRRLRRQISDVRRRGYAIEIGENEDGLMCIGVPILDGAGRPLAAMSLSAPERRMKPDIRERVAGALLDASQRISAQLEVPLRAGVAI